MKFLFIVQGEGRGHLTQAISLKNILENAGHSVERVLVGKSPQRKLPDFFYEKIKRKVISFDSPNFVLDKNGKGIRILKTIVYNLSIARRFFKSIALIKKEINTVKPDVVINFYDLLAGLHSFFYKSKHWKYVCIGHQFYLLHPNFQFPKGRFADKYLLNLNTRITSLRADLNLALSFSKQPDVPKKKIRIIPPLLRADIFTLEPTVENYIHGYMLNSGYADDVLKWHKENPDETAHFFWDKQGAQETEEISRNLFFHLINDLKFLQYMSKCKAYISTAGFESVCEAIYLGKPIMMIPTQGHYEQKCNAWDAFKIGAGIIAENFDVQRLIEFIPDYKFDAKVYREWVNSGPELFITILKELNT